MFVLQRVDGVYVARAGSMHAYTTKLEEAQVFRTVEAAEASRCVLNERVVPVENLLKGRSR
jgi:hypothetical protein